MTQSCRNTSPYELVPMTNIDFFAKCGGSILDQVLLSYSSFCTAWNSMWWRHVGGKISQGRISIGSKTTGSLFLCFSKKTSKNKIELNIFFYNFVDGFVFTFSLPVQFFSNQPGLFILCRLSLQPKHLGWEKKLYPPFPGLEATAAAFRQSKFAQRFQLILPRNGVN